MRQGLLIATMGGRPTHPSRYWCVVLLVGIQVPSSHGGHLIRWLVVDRWDTLCWEPSPASTVSCSGEQNVADYLTTEVFA